MTDKTNEFNHKNSSFYVDSPMPGSIKQFEPFFAANFFHPKETEIIIRRRVGGPDFKKAPQLSNIVTHKENKLAHLPLEDKISIFYSFNSKSNVSLASNRRAKHTLILHGESNKISSCRPIARLYDHVCVSGPVAVNRYLDAGIFRAGDVDGGRLIKTGDTFVQTIPYIRPATKEDEGSDWVLYAPTWENSSKPENYSSATDGYGFDITLRAAKNLCINRIAIKLHPNFGKHDKNLLTVLYNKIKEYNKEGISVRLLEHNLDFRTLLRLKFILPKSAFADNPKDTMPIKLAIVDISGMEAICLKQHIPHIVIIKDEANNAIPDTIKENIYDLKSINFGSPIHEVEPIIDNLFANDFQLRLDSLHRNAIFSYSSEDLKSDDYSVRHSALLKFINENTYWK